MAAKKKQTFEEQLEDAEKILTRIETGGQPLEEALKDYEAGLKLLDGLEKDLASMRQRITVLSGETEKPLEPLQERFLENDSQEEE